METTCYLIIIVFLLVLAVVDLFVGVSNDAVNFMNSAIGAKVARFRTVGAVPHRDHCCLGWNRCRSYAVGGDDGCGAARHYAAGLLLFQRGDDALPSRNGNGCDCP